MEKIAETRIIESNWDISTYKFKIEADALNLLMKGFKEKKILGRKCQSCGTVYVPGPTYCRKCLKEIDAIVEVKDTGTLGTFTVNLADIRGNPLDKPNIVAYAKLDGSDTWLMSRLEGWSDWKTVHSGMRVKIIWKDKTEGVLADILHFQII